MQRHDWSSTPKRAHVTPLFISLHWLPVAARIKFKTLMLAYKQPQAQHPPTSLTITNLHPLQKPRLLPLTITNYIPSRSPAYFHSLLRIYIPRFHYYNQSTSPQKLLPLTITNLHPLQKPRLLPLTITNLHPLHPPTPPSTPLYESTSLQKPRLLPLTITNLHPLQKPRLLPLTITNLHPPRSPAYFPTNESTSPPEPPRLLPLTITNLHPLQKPRLLPLTITNLHPLRSPPTSTHYYESTSPPEVLLVDHHREAQNHSPNILFHCSWNDLPTPIRNAGSLSIFKQHLKTHLFRHLTSSLT